MRQSQAMQNSLPSGSAGGVPTHGRHSEPPADPGAVSDARNCDAHRSPQRSPIVGR
jgi:hypothetical protein